MTNIPKMTPYTSQYKEECFRAWYAADRPTRADELEEILPEDKYKRKPNLEVLRRWRNGDNVEESWDVRADKLDLKARAIADDKAINSKVKMLEEQAARAKKIQNQGAEYLDAEGFDSSSSAVQAIIRGAQLERESRGLSTTILKLAQLGDDDLLSETQKLVERLLESGESVIIDVEEVLEENEEDAESKD